MAKSTCPGYQDQRGPARTSGASFSPSSFKDAAVQTVPN
jgi:hypothetical protein